MAAFLPNFQLLAPNQYRWGDSDWGGSPKTPLKGPGAAGKPQKERSERPQSSLTPLCHSEIPARPGSLPLLFRDEQRFMACQESSVFSPLIFSLPAQHFQLPSPGKGTTNPNILPERGFSSLCTPAASIPLSPGSFSPFPALPGCPGELLPCPAFPEPGRQWSCVLRDDPDAPGAHKCAFAEPRKSPGTQALPSYFWERLGQEWGGGKNLFWFGS